jgi:hypothetical protein
VTPAGPLLRLAEAIRHAAARVRLTVDMPDGSGLVLRFGEQLDTHRLGPIGTLSGFCSPGVGPFDLIFLASPVSFS